MSYILDALKRADAQRERGAVPGLHARQVTTPTSQFPHRAGHRAWLAVATTLALVGMAAGLWIWQAPARVAHGAAAESTLASPPPPAPLAQPTLTPTSIPASVSAVQPVVAAPQAVVSPPTPEAAKSASSPVPPELTVQMQPPPKPGLDPTVRETQPGPVAPAARIPSPVTKAAAAPATVPLLGNLSEDVRRQIPPLAITGAVYSDNPGQRLLLVNNQVLNQGSLAAPDVNLEEIGVKSSVFSFRGTRFRVAH